MRRRRNPTSAVVPVLLMNPKDEDDNMATRKRTTRRKTTRRRAPARRRTTRRRATTRRRRRNPKFPVKDTLLGAAAGVVAGGLGYVASQQNLSHQTMAIGVAGAGLLLGAVVGAMNKPAGAGLAGGAAAVATGAAISMYYASKQETSGMRGVRTPRTLPMAAVQAPIQGNRVLQMSGARSNMGAVRSQISPAIQAELSGLS